MPRVTVIADSSPLSADASALLVEHLQSVHLSTDYTAAQFVERVVWAIGDAEDADGTQPVRRATPTPRTRGSRPATRTRTRLRTRHAGER